MRVYRNEGNGTFTQPIGTNNPFNTVTGDYLAPAFADLDGDARLDAVVGTQGGTLRAFHNNGNGTFTELTGGANPFDGVRVDHDGTPSYFAKPGFVDLDGDGRLDAVVGESDGQLLAFHNNGDGTFTRLTGAANPFDGVDVGDRSAPGFVDLDGDGNLDALVGAHDGTLRAFHNNGDGTFTQLVGAANPFSGIDVGDRAAPAFGDLNFDGKPDALVGNLGGTLLTFHNNLPPAPAITVTVTAANDAPVSGGNSSSSGSEDDLAIAGTVPAASDIDSPTLTYSLIAGTVKVDGVSVADATVAFDSFGNYSYTPTAADHALGVADTRIITFDYLANDGGAVTAPATVTINVNGLNDAPVLTGFVPSVTVNENLVNAAPQLLDSNVTLADAEGNFAGGSLTVVGLAGGGPGRQSATRAAGPARSASPAATSAMAVSSSAASPAVSARLSTVALNGAATIAAVDALIENLTYANLERRADARAGSWR